MAPKPIAINTVTTTLVLVAGLEWLAWLVVRIFAVQPLAAMGIFRLVQILVITGVLAFLEQGPASIGWAPSTWFSGLRKGAVWSIAFGLAAAAAMLVIYLLGMNPFQIIRAPLPVEPASLVLFFFVGGLIAPVAEELCFRGIVYSFFRRWGILSALAASTSLFVVLHSFSGIPVTQIVGGIVFALAYETSHNLMVPITIHVTGNLTIFSLSLPGVFN